jgi:hypothetical protein
MNLVVWQAYWRAVLSNLRGDMLVQHMEDSALKIRVKNGRVNVVLGRTQINALSC